MIYKIPTSILFCISLLEEDHRKLQCFCNLIANYTYIRVVCNLSHPCKQNDFTDKQLPKSKRLHSDKCENDRKAFV